MTKFDFKQWIIDNKAQNKRVLNENYYEGDIDEIENRLNPIMFNTLKAVIRRAKAELDKVHNKIEADLNGRIQ